ncbi:pyridoxal phosphate-dependent aminotransferase [Paenibacillus humicola]|uniref:pyridoxal phosphate-dependent aminotransferase n=1 Tax=Paenibacillus humicola TaxID=3110540 RepID=UPI00237A8AA3|nr:aminotransferase class I/II-fold pyridoxal phosphate-dependent enzyme [Paenibacillus humicola]
MKPFAKARQSIRMNGIREIMNYAEGLSDVISLQIGEPSAATPLHIQEAAVRAMSEGYTHYTANAGLPSLREAISRRMRRDYRLDIPINRIVVTAGAVSALHLSLLALVEAGEEVLIPNPVYPNYEALVRMQGAVPVYYSTKEENGYLPVIEEIESLITPLTKAVIVNSPNNPTGTVYPKEVWEQLLSLARTYDLYILSDEIYDGLVFEGEHICPLALDPQLHDRVISIFGFSKVYAMTGWRLAYAIVPESLFPLICKLQEPVTTCASSISQKAGEAALDGPQDFVDEMRELYRRKRDLSCRLLKETNIPFTVPKGTFYIPINVQASGMTAQEFAVELLKSNRVMVAPCGSFGPGGEYLVRVCFAGDEKQLQEGLVRLGEFYASKTVHV